MAEQMKRRMLTASLERWGHAIRVLDKVIAEAKPFDIGVWCDVKPREGQSVFALEHADASCDTVCCAAGYMGQDPWFQARHFRTEYDLHGGAIGFQSRGVRIRGDEALQRFFDPLECITRLSSGYPRVACAADLFHFYAYDDEQEVTAAVVRLRMILVVEASFYAQFRDGVFQETKLTGSLVATQQLPGPMKFRTQEL